MSLMDSVANIALSKLEKKMNDEKIFGYVAIFINGEFTTTPILEPFEIVTKKDMQTIKNLLKNGNTN